MEGNGTSETFGTRCTVGIQVSYGVMIAASQVGINLSK